MKPNGTDDGSQYGRPRLLTGSDRSGSRALDSDETDVVFDFTGLHQLDLCDLAMVLTARLQASPGDRVWVRALPPSTWVVLRALGLDHLFHRYPTSTEQMD